MRKLYADSPTGVLIVLLLALFLINGFAVYYDYQLIPAITKLIAVLVFLTCYFTKRSHMANVFLTFLMFLFLGDSFSVFHFGELAGKLSKTFYLGAYAMLIFVLLGKFKRLKFEGLVSIYLVLILVLNSYFLYALYNLMSASFTDSVNLVLFISHGIALIAMAFLAFAAYLSKESTQSILFLVMVFCFIFSDVLNYICDFYVYFWVFDLLGNMLHVASLFLFFSYINNHHKIIGRKVNEPVKQSLTLKNSNQLTA